MAEKKAAYARSDIEMQTIKKDIMAKYGVDVARNDFLSASQNARITSLFSKEDTTSRNIMSGPVMMYKDKAKDFMDGRLSTEDFKANQKAMYDTYTNLPDYAPKQGMSALGGIPGVTAVEDQYKQQWKDAFFALQKVELLASQDKFGTEEMTKAVELAKLKVKELDKYSAAMDAVVKTKTAEVASLPTLSAAVLDDVRKLNKEIEDGFTPFDKYTKHIQRLNEAVQGPQLPPLSAITGAWALAPVNELQPVIDKEQWGIGAFKQYEELRKSLPNANKEKKQDNPAMIFGSREAAETMDRSNAQSLSVQEQVLEVLRETKFLHDQEVKYQREVANALYGLRHAAVVDAMSGLGFVNPN